jgi:dTDP-4-amino-4,6-dideoxygalactose transaminase
MRVPLLDLKPQYAAIRDEVREALERVIESQQFILGPEVDQAERELASYCGAAHAVGVSSGTDALLMALMAYRVGPGDEVVTTPFSFFATAGVIARLHARPVFADIDPDSFNLDAAAALDRVTGATRAILPVHLFGRCADTEPLVVAGRARGIAVIEDAAQAIGAADDHGRPAGSLAPVACFSFFPTKNLGAFGDAGMLTTADADMARLLRVLRVHGMHERYYHAMVGGNFRLDALQAAVLRVKLRHLRAWTAARRRNAELYRALFSEAGLDQRVALPADVPGHVYNQFVIRVGRRDELRAELARRGVGSEVYYPLPLHLQECFRGLGYREGDFPAAEAAAREVLALPIYPELTEAQIGHVVTSIAACLT